MNAVVLRCLTWLFATVMVWADVVGLIATAGHVLLHVMGVAHGGY